MPTLIFGRRTHKVARFASACLLAFLLAPAARAAQVAPVQAATPVDAAPTVVVLGTGAGPVVRPSQSQPANLLKIAGRAYLIDAGDNVSQQLVRAGVPVEALDVVFLTHLHYDHTLGLGSLMAFGWQMGRPDPLPIWGPRGTEEFVRREAAALDISAEIFRSQLPPRPVFGTLYPVHEIDVGEPTEIFKDDAVTVTATRNTHYGAAHLPQRSYGTDGSFSYRFDTVAGASVVFTGDSGPSANLETLATGADVLVSEIIDLQSLIALLEQRFGAGPALNSMIAHMREDHLTADDVAGIARRAGVKTVILTHFSFGPGFNPQDFVAQVRNGFPGGEVILAEELKPYAVGASE